ncbi:MAG TPA: hypothetical protein VHE37_08765, partial [Nevskiaceae bacterium]|nr:hypothetical protein [Nevskiaceae bacterium]
QRLTTLLALSSTSGPAIPSVLLLLFGLVGIVVVLVLWFELVLRNAVFCVAVAAAPISAQSAPFDANPIPVMIQTGDHDGPVAPIPFVNPAVVRPVYEKLTQDRAFIVAEASSHAEWTNYPLLPTATWGLPLAGKYSLAWMDYQLRHDASAAVTLTTADPHLSYLWDSEVRLGGATTVMRGDGPVQP